MLRNPHSSLEQNESSKTGLLNLMPQTCLKQASRILSHGHMISVYFNFQAPFFSAFAQDTLKMLI